MRIKFVIEVVVNTKDELSGLENLVDIIKTDQYRTNKSIEDIHLVSSTRMVDHFIRKETSDLEDKINQVTNPYVREDIHMDSVQEEGENI